MLPFSPPPDISHVTRHSCGAINGCQATSALTSDSFRVIVTIRSGHVLRLVLILALVVHWSQHCKQKKRREQTVSEAALYDHVNDEPISKDGNCGTDISAIDYYCVWKERAREEENKKQRKLKDLLRRFRGL
jgi:hypothetical protein